MHRLWACEPEYTVEAIFPEDEVPDKWNDCTRYNYEGIWCFTTVKGDFKKKQYPVSQRFFYLLQIPPSGEPPVLLPYSKFAILKWQEIIYL